MLQVSIPYLQDARDTRRYLGCWRKLYAAFGTQSFVARFGDVTPFLEPSPETLSDDAAGLAWLRRTVQASVHVTSTARMAMRAEDGVTDPEQRVFGVDGLTVADISAAPTTNGAHTVALAYLLGQKAAEALIRDAAREDAAASKKEQERAVRAAHSLRPVNFY